MTSGLQKIPCALPADSYAAMEFSSGEGLPNLSAAQFSMFLHFCVRFAWGINYTQLSMYRHTEPHEGTRGLSSDCC